MIVKRNRRFLSKFLVYELTNVTQDLKRKLKCGLWIYSMYIIFNLIILLIII